MRQIGMATTMYANDHQDYLPYGYSYTWPGQRELYWWQDLVRPYINSEPVYSCPSARPHNTWSDRRPTSMPRPLTNDYICNAQGGAYPESGKKDWVVRANGPFINNWENPSRKLAEIEDTTGTIAICDARYFEIWRLEQVDAWFNAGFGSAFVANAAADKKNAHQGHVAKRHNVRFNSTFTDGHAEFIKKSTLGMWTNRRGD